MFITVFFIDFIYGTCILMKARQGTKKSIQPSSRMFTVCCNVNNGFLHYPPVVHLSWM